MIRKFSGLLFVSIVMGLLASAEPAKAVLNYNIYESSGNVVIETDGSLSALPTSTGSSQCGVSGGYSAEQAVICTGPDNPAPEYLISGPTSFTTGSGSIFPASSVSGITSAFSGNQQAFIIDNFYVLGTPIISDAIFNGRTLADFGLTPASGLLGTWTLVGTTESINVRVVSSVPGPLPLLGVGAAIGFSRRLRRRINAYRSQAQN
jgi:hypothetical protein